MTINPIIFVNAFTFQSGDIRILKYYCLAQLVSYLHSNLVIFESSWYIIQKNWIYTLFTFQSGDIRIKLGLCANRYQDRIFTFQSGDIRININHKKYNNKKNLHSNLVIFEFKITTIYHKKVIVITFQSGDIRIKDNIDTSNMTVRDLHSNLVIFE